MIKNDSSIKNLSVRNLKGFFCCYNLRNRVFFDDVKFAGQKNKW